MLYTFALLRSPLKVNAGDPGPFGHYFGGTAASLDLDPLRFARVLTLHLADPALSFLRFPKQITYLPLLMDFAEGYISYSLKEDGAIALYSPISSQSASLLDEPLGRHSAYLQAIPYTQYRAALLQSAVIDESYLSQEDQAEVQLLGEEFTQIGGSLLRGADYRPYCSNPNCSGCGTQVTSSLASIAREPAPGVSFGFLPDDPAMEFSLCQSCHSLSGTVVVN